MRIDVSAKELEALGEVVEAALDEALYGFDSGISYDATGDEWPEAARQKADTWYHVGNAVEHYFPKLTTRCLKLALDLQISAIEFEAEASNTTEVGNENRETDPIET